jgi:ribosomal protein S18 acetylase RimI-like enzyme
MIETPSITIRRATGADAGFLAEAIIMAGRAHVRRGIWEVILGGTEGECLDFLRLLAVTGVPHLFHHARYMIAEADGRPAGIAGGYDPGTHGQEAMRRALPEVMERLGRGPGGMRPSERTMKVLSCIPGDIEGAWVIDSVAVLPVYRRLGLARMLLEAIIGEGRAGGYAKAQVSMYIGNDPALALYEKMGFSVHEEKRCTEFEAETGSPGMLSLVREITTEVRR